MRFTQWKDNRSVESSHIEWEEFKKEFLERWLPREKREVKVEELWEKTLLEVSSRY